MDFDGEFKNIRMLCDALIARQDFNPKIKEMLIRKWLLNTANIPFNNGNTNIEGVLTLQGKQGIGKTRLIRKIIPMYVKTGLELDPSDKDKVYQCIKYWVCELGELDATFKRDLSKLKAFITEQVDEFRRPYGLAPISYPRKTSFYATVNNEEFLKDETGNRRYWVIPVDLAITREFNWDANKDTWTWKPSTEIANRLYLKSTKGLRVTLESFGAEYKKMGDKRGYTTPPYKFVM